MVVLDPTLGFWDNLDGDAGAVDEGSDGIARPEGGLVNLCLGAGWASG